MNKKVEKIFLIGSVVSTVVIVGLLLFGLGRAMHDAFTTSPQEQAVIDQQRAEWSGDPTNPTNIAQSCMDKGGTPIISSWTGRVKSCQGLDNSKQVNVEVNQ